MAMYWLEIRLFMRWMSILSDFYQPGEIEEVKMLADLAIEVFGINNPYLLEFLRQEPRPLTKNITVEHFASQADLLRFLALVEDYYAGIPLELC